eukprot:Skav221946  [mRNA]  locus=scaffold195:486478:491102:+ [translate_table: standard]
MAKGLGWQAFSSLPTVAQRRKKHMAWIHKQSQVEPISASEKSEDPEQQQRVFSQLSAECARDMVRRKAIDNFGPPPPPSESRWALVVNHPYFERMSLAMIYLNAIWIAVDIEFNKADMVLQADSIFLIMEIVFTLYFSGELFVRFMSWEKRRKALSDSWFIFDLLLVVMMLLETWLIPVAAFIIEGGFSQPEDGANISRSASVLRIARILRVFRTARIIRVGILVEAVQTVATMEHEQIHVDFAKRVLWDLIKEQGADEDGDNRKLLFEDGEPLTFPEFMDAILTLRGSNQTTVKELGKSLTASVLHRVWWAGVGRKVKGSSRLSGLDLVWGRWG